MDRRHLHPRPAWAEGLHRRRRLPHLADGRVVRRRRRHRPAAVPRRLRRHLVAERRHRRQAAALRRHPAVRDFCRRRRQPRQR